MLVMLGVMMLFVADTTDVNSFFVHDYQLIFQRDVSNS